MNALSISSYMANEKLVHDFVLKTPYSKFQTNLTQQKVLTHHSKLYCEMGSYSRLFFFFVGAEVGFFCLARTLSHKMQCEFSSFETICSSIYH